MPLLARGNTLPSPALRIGVAGMPDYGDAVAAVNAGFVALLERVLAALAAAASGDRPRPWRWSVRLAMVGPMRIEIALHVPLPFMQADYELSFWPRRCECAKY